MGFDVFMCPTTFIIFYFQCVKSASCRVLRPLFVICLGMGILIHPFNFFPVVNCCRGRAAFFERLNGALPC